MRSRRIAILVPAATVLLAAPLSQTATANTAHARAAAVSDSERSHDVNERTNSTDRSRSDSGRSDSSTPSLDRTVDSHDAGNR